MDPVAVAADCAGLISATGSLSLKIHDFVRTCREARRDLDRVSRELQSLQSVLELIQDDVADEDKPLPPKVGEHISGLVTECASTVAGIQSCIADYEEGRLKPNVTWAIVGQRDVDKLRIRLEAHRSALELTLDVLALPPTKITNDETTDIGNDTAAIKDGVAQILDEIARLQSQLLDEATASKDSALQRFLDDMKEYTKAAFHTVIAEEDVDGGTTQALPHGNELPVLQPHEPLAPTSHDSSFFSQDELREILDPQDHQRPKPPPAAVEDQVLNGPPQQDLDQQQDSSKGKELATEPSPSLPPRPQSQAPPEETSERQRPTDDSQPPETRDPSREPANLARERPIDAQKLRERFYAAARKDSRGQPPASEKLVCNKPTSDSQGLHAELFNGTLAIDCPIPKDVLELDTTRPSTPSDEFTHWHFTAVTCPPKEFVSQNYLLRPLLFAKPRPIRTILSFRLDSSETPSEFVNRWYLIRKAIETLETLELTRDPEDPLRSALFPSGTKAWKHIMVHIHGTMNWEGLDESIAAALETMGAKRQLESALSSIGGSVLDPAYQEDATALQGERVHCTIRECTTRLSPHLKTLTRKLGNFTAGTPIQIISTATRGTGDANAEKDHGEWTAAIGELLQPELIIDMSKFKDTSGEKRFFLWKSLANKGRLTAKEEFWGSGPKAIDYADLRTQLQEIEKAQKKASKARQRENRSSEGGDGSGT